MTVKLGLNAELEKRSALVAEAIEKMLPVVHPRPLYEAGRHLVDAGGKRLRPAMLLLAGEACGGLARHLAPAAVSIELIHNFTLVHDDIMDNPQILCTAGRPQIGRAHV